MRRPGMFGCVAVCVAVQDPCSILTSQAVVTTAQVPYLGQHGWGDTKFKGLQNAYSSGQPTDEGLVLCTRDVRTHFRCAIGATWQEVPVLDYLKVQQPRS